MNSSHYHKDDFMSQQYATIFLPDISGFTDFVNHTEVEHSRHIVKEILELLINANNTNLVLAEIEGDALYFYRREALSEKEMNQQVTHMMSSFKRHLGRYEHQRICPCNACKTAVNLELKFIAAYGPLDFIEVNGQTKPFGSLPILAHRFMKNDVPIDAYLLLHGAPYTSSSEVFQELGPVTQLETEIDGRNYEYDYFDLSELDIQSMEDSSALQYNYLRKPDLQFDYFFQEEPTLIFELIANIKYRKYWNLEVKEINFDENEINRNGTTHTCVVNGKNVEFTSFGSSENSELIYGEHTKDVSPLQGATIFYILNRNQEKGTKLNVKIYFDANNWKAKLIKPLAKFGFKKNFKKNIGDFTEFVNSGKYKNVE